LENERLRMLLEEKGAQIAELEERVARLERLEALARALVLDAAEREHPNDLGTHAGSVPDRPQRV
jgi:hypothetical protein